MSLYASTWKLVVTCGKRESFTKSFMDAYVTNSSMISGLTIYSLQIRYCPAEVCVCICVVIKLERWP